MMKNDIVIAELTDKSDLYYKVPFHVRVVRVTRQLAEEMNMKIIGTFQK